MALKKAHFHVMVSVIESGMGEEQAYWTELTGLSFPACKDAEQARARMKQLEKVYMEKWLPKWGRKSRQSRKP